jgi:hypothetical protein
MEMTWPGKRFDSDKPLGRERRVGLPRFQDHRAKPEENQIKLPRNSKEKERAKNQGVTNLTPLQISRPRDLVAQGINTTILT